MGDYPVLRLIVAYGTAVAALASVVVFALIAWGAWPWLGWLAFAIALFAALLVFALGKSYAELVKLITEMLLPR